MLAGFTAASRPAASGFDVPVRFTAIRHEHKVALDAAALKKVAASAPRPHELQRYLEPDKLVPLMGAIAQLAKENTAGDATTIEKARHIYHYVVNNMRYDKSGEGWGRGD